MKSIALSRSGDTYTNDTGAPIEVTVGGSTSVVAAGGTFVATDAQDIVIGPDPSTSYATSPWTDHGMIADGDTVSLAAAALVVWEPGDYEGTYTDGDAAEHTLSAASKRAAVASGSLDTLDVPVYSPAITTTTLTDGTDTVPYSATLGIDPDGASPASPAWTITAGSLPTGLSLDGTTGEISGTPTVVESQTFTVQWAAATGETATQELTLEIVAAGSGSVTITSLSRDAFSTAGGTAVTVTGTGFDGTASVSFVPTGGGAAVAAASTTYVSGTELTAVMPALSAGMWDCVVSQTGQSDVTLTGVLPEFVDDVYTPGAGGAFEVLPAPTLTFAEADFEDGTISGSGVTDFEAWGSYEIIDDPLGEAVSGTKIFRGTGGIGISQRGKLVEAYYQPELRPHVNAPGVFKRWYMRVNQETLDAMAIGGQIKLHRDNGPAGAWFVLGIGTQFSASAPTNIIVQIDATTGLPPNEGTAGLVGNTGFTLQADEWVEIQEMSYRTPGMGRGKLWLNGKLALDTMSPDLGSDSTTGTTGWEFVLHYTQGAPDGYTLVVDADDAVTANGYIEPVGGA